MVVTDNGSNFVGSEFDDFLKMNRIRHIRTASYHHASNGPADMAVKAFKEGTKVNQVKVHHLLNINGTFAF